MILSHTKSYNSQQVTFTVDYDRKNEDIKEIRSAVICDQGVLVDITDFLIGIDKLEDLVWQIDWEQEYRDVKVDMMNYYEPEER